MPWLDWAFAEAEGHPEEGGVTCYAPPLPTDLGPIPEIVRTQSCQRLGFSSTLMGMRDVGARQRDRAKPTS
jgi:hypothetical protein